MSGLGKLSLLFDIDNQRHRSEWVSLRNQNMSLVSIQICWLGVSSVSFTSVFNLHVVTSCNLSSLTLVFDSFVYFKALCCLHSNSNTGTVTIDSEGLQTLPLTLKCCKRQHLR